MLHDLRYAVRTLLRTPGFTLSAVLALALGIGANTAVFSVVYAVLLKPLPFEDADRLVRLYEASPREDIERGPVASGTFIDWRARSHTLEALAAFTAGDGIWAIGDHAQVLRMASVSPALFGVMRVRPVIGHTFRPEDQQQGPSGDRGQVVISYGVWQRVFGGTPDVIGKTVRVEGRNPLEIIGVMPKGFGFPEPTDAWTNLFLGTAGAGQRRARSYNALARLAAGVTIDDAQRELKAISSQLAADDAENAGWTADMEPLSESYTRTARPALLALLAAVGGVLLIGCANVANLLLARATARRHEMAVRAALGAAAGQLLRQCLAEALVLSAGGVAAGVLVGRGLARVLVALAPPDIARLSDVSLSVPLIVTAIAAGLVSAILTGLAPAVQAASAARHGGLRSDARASNPRGAHLRRVLVGGEVAVVIALLTGALLLVRTFVKLRGVDLGFQSSQVLNVEARWPIGRFFRAGGLPGATRAWPEIHRALDGLLTTVSSVPGVEAAGLMTDVPLSGASFTAKVWRAGASGTTPPVDARDRWDADLSIVTGGYFAAMRTPVLRGRNFTDGDQFTDRQLSDPALPRAAVAVVNATFASRYFPGADPIGRTLVIPDGQPFGVVWTIVGVVGDVRWRAVAEAPRPAVFLPLGQHPDVFRPSLFVRTALAPDVASRALRERIAAVDPQLLVVRVRPMDDVVSGALSRPRFNLLLLSSFALIALALAAVGIYGVVAFLVAQRTREIGIRIALGARQQDVLRLVIREGMAPVAMGGLAGIAASAILSQGLRALLFGVTPFDAVSLTVAPAVLAAVALFACYLPARRAVRVDPLVALRDE